MHLVDDQTTQKDPPYSSPKFDERRELSFSKRTIGPALSEENIPPVFIAAIGPHLSNGYDLPGPSDLSACFKGRSTVNVLPRPGELEMWIWPP